MLQNWRLDLSSPLSNWSEIGATESRLIRYYRRESTRASCKQGRGSEIVPTQSHSYFPEP